MKGKWRVPGRASGRGNSGVAICEKCPLPQSLTGILVYGVMCSPGMLEALHWSLELANLIDYHLWLLPVSLGVVGGGLVS